MREGWAVKSLDDLCNIARGGSPRPIKQFITDAPDGVNWIKIADATASSKYIYKTKEKIKADGVRRSRMVYEGDFLLSNSMSFGRPYIMKTSGCIHDGWLVLSDKSGLFDQDFLYYFLGSPSAYQQFDERATGSTVRNLNIDLVRSVHVPLPPLVQQKRIVAILDQAFEGIVAATANAEKNLANARELFESYLNSIFSSPNIDGWEWDRLGNAVSSVATGPFGSLLHKSDYISGGTPIVNPINIVDGLLLSSVRKTLNAETVERLNRYVLKSGDVVIARRGEIGRCGVVEHEQNGWVCGTGCFFIQQSERLNSRFLVCLLRSFNFRLKLEKSATGATMKNLSNSTLKNLDVCFPRAVDEQTAVVSRVDTLSEKVAELEAVYNKKLTALTELKQSLLQKAFSGELTAGDADIKEESVA